MTFNQYIQSLKPTTNGIIAVALCLVIIPLCTDLVFAFAQMGRKESTLMSFALLKGYISHVPFYLLYLIAYFFIIKFVSHILKKINIEKIEP